MKYNNIITLKDGRSCTIRNGTAWDGQALLDIFNLTHEQTDYLLTYPDEHSYNAQQEAEFLQNKTDSADEIELLAVLDGKVVGSAGIGCIARKEKTRHRAEFGISIDKIYWGLGIGRALTEAAIECARNAGYAQLELEVVAANKSAIALYENVGFVEYGRNPKGFRSRVSGWQELVLMRLELDQREHSENSKHKKYIIRCLQEEETDLLKDFLYEAIFVPPGVEPPPRDIIDRPELRLYIDDFGNRNGDNCLVADCEGKIVGAVWTRIMNDYGHIDDDTPSFAISFYKEYRGQGIGSRLMVEMLSLLKSQGYKRASLAVQKANYAVKMYEKMGFETVDENDEEYIMVCEL